MNKIAILHTAKSTVPMFDLLMRAQFPAATVQNWLDDSILPMLMEDSTSLAYAFEKLLVYAQYAQRQGAALILGACSSVGEFQAYATGKLAVPFIRIDDPVTDILAAQYSRVAVLATLETTLQPSTALLRRKNAAMQVLPRKIPGAYEAALAGEKQAHDRMIADAVQEALGESEAVLLAQASMADALQLVPPVQQGRVYTSTRYVMERLKAYLG